MSSGHIARHRNYGELMERHQRDLRIRRIAVACIYLLIIISLIALYIIMKRQGQQPVPAKAIHTLIQASYNDCMTVASD